MRYSRWKAREPTYESHIDTFKVLGGREGLKGKTTMSGGIDASTQQSFAMVPRL